MDIILQLLSNRIIINAIIAWVVSQITKTIIHAITYRTLDFSRLFGDGGMPSAHSATVTAAALSVGFEEGFGSPVFGLAILFAFVVMHDAMGVRLETGKQAKILNDMMDFLYKEEPPEKKLKEFVGHTMTQVLAGFCVGIAVTLFIYL